jgi:hypothetical protein
MRATQSFHKVTMCVTGKREGPWRRWLLGRFLNWERSCHTQTQEERPKTQGSANAKHLTSEDRAGNGCGSLGSLPGTVGIPERLVPVPDATCGRRRISRIYTDPKLRFLRFFPHFIHPAQFSAFWNLHCGGVRGTVCFGSGKPRARAGGSRDAAEQTGCHAAHVGTRRTVLQKTSNGMTRRFLSHP